MSKLEFSTTHIFFTVSLFLRSYRLRSIVTWIVVLYYSILKYECIAFIPTFEKGKTWGQLKAWDFELICIIFIRKFAMKAYKKNYMKFEWRKMELDVGMLTMHSWNFCRMKTVICACASSGTTQIIFHIVRSFLSFSNTKKSWLQT